MKDIIKGLWKWILWILILLLLGGLILALRIFVIDKDVGKNDTSIISSRKSDVSDSTNLEISSNEKNNKVGQGIINGLKTIGNSTVKGYKEDEETNEYNLKNFDEAFLMYEGEQTDGKIKDVLEHLIENSKGNFYARTSVSSVNFGNDVKIDYNGDLVEYQNAIKNLENQVSSGLYEVSFKYGALKSYVNEIVITKK